MGTKKNYSMLIEKKTQLFSFQTKSMEQCKIKITNCPIALFILRIMNSTNVQ